MNKWLEDAVQLPPSAFVQYLRTRGWTLAASTDDVSRFNLKIGEQIARPAQEALGPLAVPGHILRLGTHLDRRCE